MLVQVFFTNRRVGISVIEYLKSEKTLKQIRYIAIFCE